jgi:hypothetical protein
MACGKQKLAVVVLARGVELLACKPPPPARRQPGFIEPVLPSYPRILCPSVGFAEIEPISSVPQLQFAKRSGDFQWIPGSVFCFQGDWFRRSVR